MKTAKSFCDQINALLLKNQLDGAESLANEAKALFPGEFSVLERCAHVMHRKGLFNDAEEAYRNFLEKYPEKAVVWVGLINALLQQKKIGDAERVAKKAKSLFPDDFAIIERCAHVMHRKGMFSEAEEAYRSILKRFSGKAVAWVGLINALLLQKKLGDAEKVANEAKTLFPGEFSILERCAHCLSRNKKFTESFKIYKGIENRFTSPAQYRDFAFVLDKRGELDDSRKVYQLALKRFGNNQLISNSYSNFLMSIGDYQGLMELIDAVFLSLPLKKAFFMGNCQAAHLADMLGMHTGFSSEYSTIRTLPPIHNMAVELQRAVIDMLLPKIDLFVTQDIRNLNFPLRTEEIRHIPKRIIVFPTLHFSGYFPDIIYLKMQGQVIRSTPLTDYHSALVLVSFYDGVNAEECSKQLLSGDWIHNGYESLISSLVENLYARERFWDVKITRFIVENFKNQILFHTVNHPNACLLHEVANSILSIIHREKLHQSIINETSGILSQIKWIINDRIKQTLSSSQEWNNFFLINGEKMSASDFVLTHYKFYEQNLSLVECNVESCRNALFSWQE